MTPHPVGRTPGAAMFSEPVPLFTANDLGATASFWTSLRASAELDGDRLRVRWDDAVVTYEAARRPAAPRITTGVGFIWHVDLDAVLLRAVEVGLWTVTVAEVHDAQQGFDARLAAGRPIARIGLPRTTPTDVWECRLFDPSNNLLRLVAGPPQHPRSAAPDDTRVERP